MKPLHQLATWYLFSILIIVIVVSSTMPLAHAVTPITPSGLNTQVTLSATPPPGHVQYDITGGTRPGGGANLFHSFGNFNVPNNNIANFLNDSGLATSNILGRVTGGNISNIFGTIQTTGFGNANLFLMNPAGFLFGPNATVNVGGMVTFTSADYLRLADGARFNAVPHTAPDLLLSAAPVAAFGFLGFNPGAITVKGSQLSVTEGSGISMVGGNIRIKGGTLTAPSGNINLVSVGKPSHHKVGGEVVIAGSGSGFTPTGFASLGAITLSQGSTVDTSGIAGTGQAAGGVSIRGGQLVMNDSSITAHPAGNIFSSQINGNIDVTADNVTLSNHSTLDTSTEVGPFPHFTGPPGYITFNVKTFSATDSGISAGVDGSNFAPSGAVTIQGLQGSGTSARSVSLSNTTIDTSNSGLPSIGHLNTAGGPILIRADNIALNQSSLSAFSAEQLGGTISLFSNGLIKSHSSRLSSTSFFGSGGSVELRAGTGINLTNTSVAAPASIGINGGTITMAAPVISIRGGTLNVMSGGGGPGGTISLTGTKAISLTNGTLLTADNALNPPFPIPPSLAPTGGTILINGGHLFTSHQSTISAQSELGNGGTIHIDANKVSLRDTQITTSVSGGPQTVAGSITLDAKKVTLKNSQILSTATEGQGGAIGITTHKLHQDAGSVIDASSQSGTDGTVTINGIIQP